MVAHLFGGGPLHGFLHVVRGEDAPHDGVEVAGHPPRLQPLVRLGYDGTSLGLPEKIGITEKI